MHLPIPASGTHLLLLRFLQGKLKITYHIDSAIVIAGLNMDVAQRALRNCRGFEPEIVALPHRVVTCMHVIKSRAYGIHEPIVCGVGAKELKVFALR